MAKPKYFSDIDERQIIFRYHQGIKLFNPEDVTQVLLEPGIFNTGRSVASLSSLPFNFYFLNLVGSTLLMNQQCVEVCGFQSSDESLGKSLFDVSNAASAAKLMRNSAEVIVENKIKIFEEENIRNDGVSLKFLSVKSPWYDDANQIKGTFGCSIVLGTQSLGESLQQIADLGLLNPTNHAFSTNVIPCMTQNSEILSERESLCVWHLCKGYTMKETAKIVGLSPKTVETYIDRAKQKFKCKNKAELIAAFIQQT
jgi:DNA-binding CsgD family transcriptional regulator